MPSENVPSSFARKVLQVVNDLLDSNSLDIKQIPDNFVFVNSRDDLGTSVNNVYYLQDNYTYFFTTTVDLLGRRIVCGNNTTLIGGSSENCRIKSTGLTGTALITSSYSLPIRNLTIEADLALNLNAEDTPSAALDWFGVNFTDCNSCGTITNYNNFIATDCAWLNSGPITYDGNHGTIGFSQCIFTPKTNSTAIIIPQTAVISRRFRIIYSAFVVTSGRTGINFHANASVPDENYILDTINFSGGGTYTTGINNLSDKVRWINCIGITNTIAICNLYMKNNSVATDIQVQNNRYAMSGVTEFASISQRFEHVLADNAARYTSAIPRRVKVQCSFTIEGPSNNILGVYIGKCTSGNGLNPDADRISESEVYVTASGTRPDSAFIQAVTEANEGDKFYVIVQNTSGTGDITIEFMNMIIEQAVT